MTRESECSLDLVGNRPPGAALSASEVCLRCDASLEVRLKNVQENSVCTLRAIEPAVLERQS